MTQHFWQYSVYTYMYMYDKCDKLINKYYKYKSINISIYKYNNNLKIIYIYIDVDIEIYN